MILELRLPLLNVNMSQARIEFQHVAREGAVKSGEKLFDLSIMLGANFAQDCPPISYFRLVGREQAWVRKILVNVGDFCENGALLALLSTTPDEALDAAPGRPLRCASASILYHIGMISGNVA